MYRPLCAQCGKMRNPLSPKNNFLNVLCHFYFIQNSWKYVQFWSIFFTEKRKDDSSPKKSVNSKQNIPKSSPVNSLDYGVLCPCCDRVFQDLYSAVSIRYQVASIHAITNWNFDFFFSNFRKGIGRVRSTMTQIGMILCQILRKRLGINLSENWQLPEFLFWNRAIL